MAMGVKTLYAAVAITAPGANTNLISGGIAVSGNTNAGINVLRVEIAMASGASSVLFSTISDGTSTKNRSLFAGATLTGPQLFTCEVGIANGETFNLILGTNGAINSLKVYGLYEAVS